MNRLGTLLCVLLLLSAMLLAGCGEDAAPTAAVDLDGSDDYQKMDFSQPLGGLTVTDEAAAFDDQALMLELLAEDEDAVDDPLALEPEIAALLAEGDEPVSATSSVRPVFTTVRLQWGMLHGPIDTLLTAACGVLDWTGEVHTDRGVVLVRRVIRFERPGDHLIWPRLDAQTVAFSSHTGCHFDGLVLQIIERPEEPADETLEPNRLHINTGPFQAVIDVSELAGMDRVVDVDELGNRFQVTGFRVGDLTYCPKGFLSGRYRHLKTDDPAAETDPIEDRSEQLGTFAGTWVDLSGRIRGFLRGGYGLDEAGDRVFYGKAINRSGRFEGILAGTWEPGGTEIDLGIFKGRWLAASGSVVGVLGGTARPVEGYPGGFFTGRWTTLCDEEAVAEVSR